MASSCKYEKTENIEVKFYTLIVLTPGLCAYGTSTSVIAIILLCRKPLRGPSSTFLCALSIYDIGVLVFAVWLYTMEILIDYRDDADMYRGWIVYTPLLYFLSHCCKIGSVYVTVGATVERWIGVSRSEPCHRRLCGNHRTAFWIALISIFSVLFSLPKYYELTVIFKDHCQGFARYYLNQSLLAIDPVYKEAFSLWTSQMVMVVIPFIALIVFNTIIAYKTNHSTLSRSFGVSMKTNGRIMFTEAWRTRIVQTRIRRKRRDATKILFFIAILFLICNTPDLVLTCIEHVQSTFLKEHKYLYNYARDVTNLLATFNSAANSTIYVMFGKQLRREFWNLMRIQPRRKKAPQESPNHVPVKRLSQYGVATVPPSRAEEKSMLSSESYGSRGLGKWRCGSMLSLVNTASPLKTTRSPSAVPELSENENMISLQELQQMYIDLQRLHLRTTDVGPRQSANADISNSSSSAITNVSRVNSAVDLPESVPHLSVEHYHITKPPYVSHPSINVLEEREEDGVAGKDPPYFNVSSLLLESVV